MELQLTEYRVREFSYRVNAIAKNAKIDLNTNISRVIETGENDYRLILSADIGGEFSPFEIHVAIVGTFEASEELDEQQRMATIKTNATAILYPFLRALLTSITADAEVPPLILPVCNIVSYFDEKEQKN